MKPSHYLFFAFEPDFRVNTDKVNFSGKPLKD